MTSYRAAFLATIVLIGLFFAPVLLRGHVLFPHDNALEVGVVTAPSGEWTSNRTFSDLSCCYVPELNQQLNGDHTRWISTWNPHVELGRPAPHTFGFTKAYWLTHLLSFATTDPFRVYTLLTIATVLLAGLFFFALLRELELAPAACFFGAAGVATGVFVTFWLSFVMFAATVCWASGLLWGIAIFTRRPTAAAGLLIAFAVASLLLTGYPQQIVHHAWFLAGFAVLRTWREQPAWGARARVLALLGLAGLLGVVAVSPVLYDLFANAARSTRYEYGREYFLAGLPDLAHPERLGLFLQQLFDAFRWGNPITSRYPVPFDGLSLTPAYAVLVLVALAAWRRVGYWLLVIAFAGLASVWPALYGFGVDRLGWNISRFLPLASAWIPFGIVAATGADHLLRGPRSWKSPVVWIGLALPAAAVLHLGVGESAWWTGAAFSLGLAVVALAVTARAPVLVAITVITPFLYGQRLFLARPVASIHTSSDLVEALRERTADGSRYAFLGSRVIPPNQESLLGIRSIHTFDSLAPAGYQDLVSRISRQGMINEGRIFAALDHEPLLGADALSFTGVRTVVSARPLSVPGFEQTGAVIRGGLWSAARPVLLEAQLDGLPAAAGDESGLELVGPLHGLARLDVACTERRDDRLRLRTTAVDRPTVLFLSQQHHPAWRASSAGRRLETVLLNGFYLGVRLPPDTADVVLSFDPAVRWAWVPQLLFAATGAAWCFRRAQRRRRSSASAAM